MLEVAAPGHRVINFPHLLTHHITLPFELKLGFSILFWQPMPIVES